MKRFVFFLLISLVPAIGVGHPVPDIPVRAFFEANGTVKIEVEVDLRCFAEDPHEEPYVFHWAEKEFTKDERKAYFQKATGFVKDSVAFFFEPKGKTVPQFKWRFTSHRGEKLEGAEDPVILTGTWETKLEPDQATGYRIEALPEGRLSVLFLNHIDDQAVKRFQVLFPGEKSYRLDLTGEKGAPAAGTESAAPASR